MLRRLEIATAPLNRPEVLFLDEPTVGLDPTARELVWERGARAARRGRDDGGRHNPPDGGAERHCDRLAIMDAGRIVDLGTPSELLSRLWRFVLGGALGRLPSIPTGGLDYQAYLAPGILARPQCSSRSSALLLVAVAIAGIGLKWSVQGVVGALVLLAVGSRSCPAG